MENKNENKKSKLVFDMKLVRKLLKMNGEINFCPYCGKSVEEGCSCHRNIIVDVKPFRNNEGIIDKDRSVIVFDNNKAFLMDYNRLMEETTAKKTEIEPERLVIDLD